MPVYQLLYVSKANDRFSESDIEQILNSARKYNSKAGITGILLFKSGLFLQLLEGPKAAVRELYDKRIKTDPRHESCVELLALEQNERAFQEWSMGYHKVSDLDVKMVNEFLSWNRLISAAKDIDNHLIFHMLERFKQKLK